MDTMVCAILEIGRVQAQVAKLFFESEVVKASGAYHEARRGRCRVGDLHVGPCIRMRPVKSFG